MLPPLLEAAELDKLPGYLQPSCPEMDDVAGRMLVEALNGRNNTTSTLMKRLLTFPGRSMILCHSQYIADQIP